MNKEWDLIITNQSKLLSLHLSEVWRYRDLLLMYVKRDVVTLYKQTILGPLWFLIQPLLTTIMFMCVFGGIAGISVDDNSKCLIENCTYNGKLVSNSDIVNGGVIGYNRNGQAANNLTVTNCTVNGTLVNIPEAE